MNRTEVNEEQVREWYSLHSDSILKYIMMMVRDYHKAEDLTHETYIRAFKSSNTLDDHLNAKAWLFSIARNLTVDYLRRQKRYRFIMQLMLTQEKDASELTEHMMIIKESSAELYNALFNLKDTYREVIILRKIKEFSIIETCQILNWSESKVKNTLLRAMKALEQELKKEELRNGKIS